MDLKATYNRISEDWFRDHHDDTWWIEGTDYFAALFPRGGAILDVGCGAGTKTKYLAGKDLRVTGIDFSEGMIAVAKRENPESEFHVMDMRNLATLPEDFDGIFAQASLLHIAKKEVSAVLKGFYNKLKSGGCLYIAVKEKKPGAPDQEVKTEDDYGYAYERFFSYFTMDELHRDFEEFGMEVVYESVTSAGKTRWIQIIGRK
ncbi:MAG: class I SAM-dependent methyltransferase [bacterium]|nr:class I SAM-dependent methyltransferase [bacterium]